MKLHIGLFEKISIFLARNITDFMVFSKELWLKIFTMSDIEQTTSTENYGDYGEPQRRVLGE